MTRNFVSRRAFIGLAAGATGGLGLLLAACGGPATTAPSGASATTAPAAAGAQATTAPSGQAAAQPAAAAGAAGATVNWLVRTTPAENNGQQKVYEPAIKAKYPDLKINRIIVPQTEYIPKINTMAAAKESLEIWGFGGNYFDYWARGLTTQLDQYITADKWDVDNYFQQGLMNIFKVHGHYNGLSQLTTYGQCVIYNKDLLDAAGVTPPPVDWTDNSWTYPKLLDAAHKLTKNYGKPDGQYGVYLDQDNMTDLAWIAGVDNFLPEHYQNGIAAKTNFNNPGNVDAHQMRHDWIYKEQVMPDPSMAQGLSQMVDVFHTGKVAMYMTGGWLYWNSSDITSFKFGFGAMPFLKSNKDHNYDDFWIMGHWSTNKDNAWKVMRVLTDAQVASDYSVLSGTPPTPRAALAAWLKKISEHTGQSIDDLTKVTTGAIDPSHSQESEDHLFIQYPKISDTYTNEIQPLWADGTTSAAKMIPTVTQKLDAITSGIYDQFKDSLPKD